MRKYVVSSLVLLPFLLGLSYADQSWSIDQSAPWVYPGEEGGTSSYLGVDISDVTAERLSALKLKEEKGVEVTMVDQDAPAGKAGIKEHDVILTMNGTAIESGAQLRRMIHETPPGRTVTLGLSRDGQPLELKLQLADKHKAFSFATPKPGDIHVNIPEIHVPDIDIPAMHMIMVTSSARSGLTVENITQQLGDFFGVKNGNGVLVRAVEKGSRAEKAGFRAGDVIVKVNNEAIHDTSDFQHAVKSRSADSVSVGVVRDKKEQNLNLTLPARKESGDLIDESSFVAEPLIQADSDFELSELGGLSELAKLQPQMQLAIENSRKTMQELRQELCQERKELRKQAEKQGKQIQKNVERIRMQIRRMQEELI